MTKKDMDNKLQFLIADLKEEAALEVTKELLANDVDPLDIINQCHRGMFEVGERYARSIYFLSGLIMAGEIMRQVGQLVLPRIAMEMKEIGVGIILLGTVQGDIHNLGKDIYKVLARVYGFSIHDLGVDVPPAKFVSAIHEFKPDIVGLSCLVSSAFQPMKETIEMMRENTPEHIAPRAYIIGGRVDEYVCKDVGADFWTNEAMKGVQICQQIMSNSAR